jgi:hypothetical protein
MRHSGLTASIPSPCRCRYFFRRSCARSAEPREGGGDEHANPIFFRLCFPFFYSVFLSYPQQLTTFTGCQAEIERFSDPSRILRRILDCFLVKWVHPHAPMLVPVPSPLPQSKNPSFHFPCRSIRLIEMGADIPTSGSARNGSGLNRLQINKHDK